MDLQDTPGFDKSMERLQAVVRELEQADLPLERSVALYKEGRALAKACETMLEQAKNEIILCDEDEERPFSIENGSLLISAGDDEHCNDT